MEPWSRSTSLLAPCYVIFRLVSKEGFHCMWKSEDCVQLCSTYTGSTVVGAVVNMFKTVVIRDICDAPNIDVYNTIAPGTCNCKSFISEKTNQHSHTPIHTYPHMHAITGIWWCHRGKYEENELSSHGSVVGSHGNEDFELWQHAGD